MSAPKKTAVATLALMGALMGGIALAQDDAPDMPPPGGPGGPGEGRGAMLAEMFDTIDANKDGKVTQEELAAHRKAEFTATDTNGDGALSSEELQARMLAQMLARQSARMIDNMDDDGNCTLSEAEMDEGPVARNLARIDTDNDGAISKEEAAAMMQHHKKRGHGGGWGGWGMGDN